MDCIYIKNLKVFAKHGVFEEENRLGQLFVVSAKLYTDTYKAGITDGLDNSIDYGEMCHLIEKSMTEKTFNLIESAAWHCVKKILLVQPKINEVELTIDKPWAPIGLNLDSAGVCVTAKRHKAWIGIGSNMGDSKTIVAEAIQCLANMEDISVVKISDFIITPPYGNVPQPDFLNGCIEIETIKTPHQLLDTLMAVEQVFGRERTLRWGPRTLDLDILLFDHEIINEEKLTIPHVDMTNRLFVLEPLAQIADWYVHPIAHQSIGTLYHTLKQKG